MTKISGKPFMLKEMRYSRKQGEENKGIRFIFYTPPEWVECLLNVY
jgi:hypothetical protein